MKFAKELEEDAVPEWRIKYLDYKQGKKKIKGVSKALKNLNRTPGIVADSAARTSFSNQETPFTHYDFNRPRAARSMSMGYVPEDDEVDPGQDEEPDNRPPVQRHHTSQTMFAHSPPIYVPGNDQSSNTTPERTPLVRRQLTYGSIVGTPPDETPGSMGPLELPDPALTPQRSRPTQHLEADSTGSTPRLPPAAQVPTTSNPYHVGETHHPPGARHSLGGSLAKRMFKRGQTRKGQSVGGPLARTASFSASQRFRNLFSPRNLTDTSVDDVQLSAYRELDEKQAEFFTFLDKELKKIEEFYKSKENEATERLQVLRSQLHEMRDRRITEIMNAKKAKDGEVSRHLDAGPLNGVGKDRKSDGNGTSNNFIPKQFEELVGRRPTIGKTSQAMAQMSSPPGPQARQRINDGKKDYVRKEHAKEVKYTFAKRRLKTALQEFYRGLELLKSYTLVNRTGFRKINKKYDKAVQARPPLRYMAEKINLAYFVTSDVVDNHLIAVEDLYSRYFERGNHKIAVKKLRSKVGVSDYSGVTFRNGLYLAAGVCFGIAGLVNAHALLNVPDPTIALRTSYLLQLYGGYFLVTLLFLMFTLDCRMWAANHINYPFIFEYDTRHVLDWRQLAELPCFFAFLCGLFLYINFRTDAADWTYIYYPLFLIIITVFIIFLPFPLFYPQARKWFAESNLRLICAPFFPVEFRDFYLGDMYCSQTYAMGQIELFFCLYVNSWQNPHQCNSGHSRLLGFFAALPAVWRALQCLRRYYDSRNWFPHLANCAKYGGNIAYYATLSIYRIDMTYKTWAIFVTFALLNGLYCSFWDIYLDWSLGDVFTKKHPFLRERLAYKQVWIYYVAMVLDVILRQQWIFYALFAHDVRHSSIMSFVVSLAEVLRRGMWSLFRVENEHCNNVGKFRASRDIPLPYDLPDSRPVSSVGTGNATTTPRTQPKQSTPANSDIPQAEGASTATDLEASPSLPSLRKRRTPTTPKTPAMRAIQRVGTIIGLAHAQDFERRRKPGSPETDPVDQGDDGSKSSDEDDSDDDELGTGATGSVIGDVDDDRARPGTGERSRTEADRERDLSELRRQVTGGEEDTAMAVAGRLVERARDQGERERDRDR